MRGRLDLAAAAAESLTEAFHLQGRGGRDWSVAWGCAFLAPRARSHAACRVCSPRSSCPSVASAGRGDGFKSQGRLDEVPSEPGAGTEPQEEGYRVQWGVGWAGGAWLSLTESGAVGAMEWKVFETRQQRAMTALNCATGLAICIQAHLRPSAPQD